MKKLIKSDICGSVNSAQMHYSRLKKSAFTAESKKKKKKGLKRVCAQMWTQNAQTKHSLNPKFPTCEEKKIEKTHAKEKQSYAQNNIYVVRQFIYVHGVAGI